MLNRSRTLAAALISLLLIAACGQKGPLFLPGDPSQIKTVVPNQGNTPEQQTDGDSDDDSDGDSDDDSDDDSNDEEDDDNS